MLGILLGLALLIFLSYRGFSIIWVAPLSALVVVIYAFGIDAEILLNSYLNDYMGTLAGFAKSWFPMFLMGAIFGKLMDVTGAAKSVAQLLTGIIGTKRAMLGVIIACGVLTYGGVSLFVVVFAIYPLGLALFREANIPRRILPACIALGAFTFSMTAMPGTPQLNNLIPMQFFNTTPMAAPIMGIVSALVMLGGGYFYLTWREGVMRRNGEVFDEPASFVKSDGEEILPNAYLSCLPLITVILTLNVLKLNIVICLLIGNILTALLNMKKVSLFTKALNEGANGATIAIMNTAAAVGFGGVVRAVPGFKELSDILLGLKGSPLISEAVAVTTLAGATGSASGGMTIALNALGPKYMELAMSQGIDPAAFHRIAAIASGGLDTLPHNGAVLTLLAVTELDHNRSYVDIGMVTCIIPLASLVAALIMGTIGII